MSETRQAIVERATRLTRERIGPRAPLYDREARNPVESWRDLWGGGLLGIAIPAAHGGLGADVPTYLGVIDAIARGCASTAMTLHMHSTVMRFVAALGTAAQQARYFREVIERGTLFGSWGSEPAVSQSRTFLVETSLRASAGGFVVDGLKHFCTMAGGAGYYMVWCALEGDPDVARSVSLVLVPADTPGIAIQGTWDTLGMRGTYSPTVQLKDCRVDRDTKIGDPGMAMRIGVAEMFALGYAAIYVGIAQGALDFALEYCKTRTYRPDPAPIAHEPTVQRHLG